MLYDGGCTAHYVLRQYRTSHHPSNLVVGLQYSSIIPCLLIGIVLWTRRALVELERGCCVTFVLFGWCELVIHGGGVGQGGPAPVLHALVVHGDVRR